MDKPTEGRRKSTAPESPATSSEPITNSDVFLWALYELGGESKFVDVEEAFLRAFELAPLRLSWRTRSDIPDLKKCSKALRDAEGREPKLLVKQGPEMRRLTVEGQKWIEANFDRLVAALSTDRVVRAPRTRDSSRLVAQALRSSVFAQWKESRTITDEKWKVAEMLRCSPDSSRAVWRERLEALRASANASGRLDALEFFDSLARERAAWF